MTLSFERQRDSDVSTGRTTQRGERRVPSLLDESRQSTTIAQVYRARWEVELLFMELKSRFVLDEVHTTDAYIIEALIIMAAISLPMSRVIVNELRSLEARQ
ncbi:transposase [Haloquadratum walsbyi]|uniref:transposase n=1 Tax=Haloquadratum walsbyi TaxID=293091 RepID=UPI0009D6BB6E|nr:transposase [Haloquadratum walsbyi]